ncbi:MAG: lipoyl synthase [Deltaproteobacteria bacterium]|nr:lipoyl synthase [Deltaproteobacteria bacterium]
MPRTSKRELRPAWLRTRLPGGEGYARVRRLLREHDLHTVCDEARCPNKAECWESGTATFLLMGDRCTRSCRFCSVATADGALPPPDPCEAMSVVEAARTLGLRHVVLTSVTRDDLEDGGAGHIARVILALREHLPGVSIEALIPAFDDGPLRSVLDAGLDVLAHNVEVVRRLTPLVRDGRADYDRSLEVLREAKRAAPQIRTKSSLLLGLGETREEVLETLVDLRGAGVELIALGQYLMPTDGHAPVEEYVTPEAWDEIRAQALDAGFTHVAAGPFVRTSFRAHEAISTVPEVEYAEGLALQDRAQGTVRAGGPESLIVITHPPVITLGRMADQDMVTCPRERLARLGIDVVRTNRGGEVTYHAPGQLVIYPILDLERRRLGGRRYVSLLLDAVQETLEGFGIDAFLIEGLIGVFAQPPNGPPAKIAAAGVSISRSITGHGIAVNVTTDLSGYTLIVPCGLTDHAVTSMKEILDRAPSMEEVASRLVSSLRSRLGQELRRLP